MGFRYFALVTGNDTDPSYVAKARASEGTSEHGMYFRVNGALLWSRGANVIPMDAFGIQQVQAIRVQLFI